MITRRQLLPATVRHDSIFFAMPVQALYFNLNMMREAKSVHEWHNADKGDMKTMICSTSSRFGKNADMKVRTVWKRIAIVVCE